MSRTTIESPLLTIAEAAGLLGVSVSTLRNWDRRGQLTPRRHPINGYRMYNRTEIVRLKELIEGRDETER